MNKNNAHSTYWQDWQRTPPCRSMNGALRTISWACLQTLDGVEYGRDDFGNIIARYTAPAIAALPESEREPPIAFVAHMDHPGYEIVRPCRRAGR